MPKLLNYLSSILLSSMVGVSLTVAMPSNVNGQIISQEDHNTMTNNEHGSQENHNTMITNGNVSLFVNLTSDDIHRAGMAISFAQSVLQNGHKATIFLNINGVRIATNNIPQHINGITDKSLQEMLQEFIAQGGTVIACPSCLKLAGVGEDELMEGVIIGSPQVTQPLLFADDVRVMSW